MADQNKSVLKAENILVLGAYGLIGHGIVRRLLADGHSVRGLGRNEATARRSLPNIDWAINDMRTLTSPQDWSDLLSGVSVVVNSSGVLQDGSEDDVETIHNHAIAALAKACAKQDIGLIQISAVGATLDASTKFLASKARGDAAIKASGASYHIFRPGLVLAETSYGGTALLRMLAAIPNVQPLALPDAKIQVISLDDISSAVAAAVAGHIPANFECDLVHPETHTLKDIVAAVRSWLGFAPAKWDVTVSGIAVRIASWGADRLSGLGWRSPLRSTAVKVLQDGVLGQHADLTPYKVPAPKSLNAILSALTVGTEDRLHARMLLLSPLVITCLCMFWLLSGVIGLFRLDQASGVLIKTGWPTALAMASVIVWSLVDIAIGAAFAVRRWAANACWASIAVSVIYLIASTLFVPHLWLDPLGPLIKIIPAIALALVARAILETR